MHVLLMETEPGTSDATEAELREAGHDVSRCRESRAEAFPCVGIEGRCPLDRGDVDLVVTVRDPHRSDPSPFEDGVVCSVRRRIPLVVAGTSDHPYTRYAARTVTRRSNSVRVCEAEAAGLREPHGAIAATAARAVLATHGIESDVIARVRRQEGRLAVELVVSAPDVPVGMLTARVASVLRVHDAYAAAIDVAVHRS